jgi:methionyl-tRNA formyltransferase
MRKPKIVFMGSPEFALPGLQKLAEEYPVVGVVTQPDRPAGRGRTLKPPPVKELAMQLGLPVIQPERLREPAAMEQLQSWQPDIIVVAAFGQILRPSVLNLPSYGCINIHGSLLPRWRGAAPIQAAILTGDEQTGITIMKMDPGIDTGPMLSQRAIPITDEDTAATLSQKLAHLGAELLLETLPGYLERSIHPVPQDESAATYASMLSKEDGRLDLRQPARALARKVRAYNPWPGAFIRWEGQVVKIHRALTAASQPGTTPGQTIVLQRQPALVAGEGILILQQVQPPGKKPMLGEVFLNGARGWGRVNIL